MADEATSDKQRLERLKSRLSLSKRWMADTFYDEWESVYQNYKAVPEPYLDDDGNEDKDIPAVSSPITFAQCRRTTARVTAQIPQFQFIGRDSALSDMIGRTLMYQWDRAHTQRQQKKHVLQAVMLGWSVRAWSWLVDDKLRRKRVSLQAALTDPNTLREIASTYDMDPKLLAELQQTNPRALAQFLARKVETDGRGGMLPVEYIYRHFEGPSAEFLFVGDVFPEPHFQDFRNIKWLLVNRRRDLRWMADLAAAYPELKKGVQEVLKEHPEGTGNRWQSSADTDEQDLFERMLNSINRSVDPLEGPESTQASRGEWLVTEHHVRGARENHLEFAVGDTYIGRIPYPYDLGGMLAFTDCVLIDDIISGVGDSIARVMRNLHRIHSDQLGYRNALVRNILRPLILTSDRELLEDPEAISRKHGFRLAFTSDPQEIRYQDEMGAIASASAAMGEENGIYRNFYLLSGENNMSMSADVDPAQLRTAAGVNQMARAQDVLTKDLQDALVHSSLTQDAEVMWHLNRSELADAVEFPAGRYNRAFSYEEDRWKDQWVRVEPMHFQVDGEVTVKVGSTLAEDDERERGEAWELFGAATKFPNLLNPERARDELLIRLGKRDQLPQWIPPPPPPPGPPPPKEPGMNISAKWEDMTDAEKAVVRKAYGFDLTEPAPQQPQP